MIQDKYQNTLFLRFINSGIKKIVHLSYANLEHRLFQELLVVYIRTGMVFLYYIMRVQKIGPGTMCLY